MGVRLSFVSDLIESGIIGSIIVAKRGRWFQRRHYRQHYQGGTRQMVPETALSAALSGRNAADGSQSGIICGNIGTERGR